MSSKVAPLDEVSKSKRSKPEEANTQGQKKGGHKFSKRRSSKSDKTAAQQREGTAQGHSGANAGTSHADTSGAHTASANGLPERTAVRSVTKKQLDPALQSDVQAASKNSSHKPYIQTRDKVMFLISVMNVILLAAFTSGFQWLLPYYYTLEALPYLFLRFWTYGRGRYAYFLLDLCYWGNFSLLLYLWLPAFEYSDYFFAGVYALATGPMGWAVIIFRNSMVFHSLDKSISNFIHLGPIIVVFAIRWHSPISENISNQTTDIAGHMRNVYYHNWTGFGRFKVCETDQPCFQDWWIWFFLIPCAAQLLWVFFYALATRACCKLKDHHVDAFRYLTAKGGILAVLGKMKNQKLAYFVYNLVNYFANVGMTFPAALFYFNYYANLAFIALLVTASIWNGANFYIDVFSKKYLEQVQKQVAKDEVIKRKRSVGRNNSWTQEGGGKKEEKS